MSTIVLKLRTSSKSTTHLLFGETRGRILSLLFGAPDRSFFVRQIARQVETSVGTVQRELTLLAAAGLIERTPVGSQVFFRANRAHPAFHELHGLLAKTIGVFHLLEQALTHFAPRIRFAFVYGSVARAEDTAASDVDLMVVGDVSLDEILDAVSPVEKQIGGPVNPTIYTLHDFTSRFESGNHFLRSLENSTKVFLISDENAFRKACATRLVQHRAIPAREPRCSS